MNTSQKLSGLALASATALLLSACTGEQASNTNAATEAKIKCSGVNACKGKSACATATTSCKGHNACKGQGWVEATKTECEEQGGSVS
jgi:uncharacterized membrane protein